MITKINNYSEWLKGNRPLPAGAIPLASENFGPLICLTPRGRWIQWVDGVMSSLPTAVQSEAMEVIVSELGGTAQTVADHLTVSKRTVESWRSGRSPLPISKAFEIAELIAEKSNPT